MKRLFELFRSAGFELFLVGGAVRDMALGRPYEELKDLDFATNAHPAMIERLLHGGGLGTYKTGWSFGTVGTMLRGEPEQGYPKDVQITTYRTQEIYLPGSRHPEVRFGNSLEQDLKRRDLSINSMAMDSEGKILDPFSGLADIEAKKLRVVGDPDQTLREDPLRILRIARFVSELGFKPTDRLRRAAERTASSILDISRERWLMEMNKLLLGRHVSQALVFLQQSRVLGFILPEVAATVDFDQTSEYHHKDVWHHTIQVVAQSEPRLVLRWAALLHDIGKVWTREIAGPGKVHFFRHEDMGAMLVEGIASRFRFPNPMRNSVRFLVKHHLRANLYDGSWTDSAVRRFNNEMGEELPDLLDLSRADVTSANPARKQRALELVEELSKRSAAIAEMDGKEPLLPKGLGRMIMERFHIEPGRRIGELRDLVEEALLKGTLPPGASAEQMIEYLAGLDLPETRAAAPAGGTTAGSEGGAAPDTAPAGSEDVDESGPEKSRRDDRATGEPDRCCEED